MLEKAHILRLRPRGGCPFRLLIPTRVRPIGVIATVVAAIAFASPAGAQAATLNVCPGGCAYSAIQPAVNAAAPGDTITVGAGTYTESVTIPSGLDGLTISGAEAGTAADGSGPGARAGGESVINPAGTAFSVESNSVTIDGFTVRDGSIGVLQYSSVSGLRLL